MKKNFLEVALMYMVINDRYPCDVSKIGDPSTAYPINWKDFSDIASFSFNLKVDDNDSSVQERINSFQNYVIIFNNNAWLEFKIINGYVEWLHYKKPEFAQEEAKVGDKVTYCPACNYPASLKVINEYYISQDEPCPDCGKHSLAEFVEKQ